MSKRRAATIDGRGVVVVATEDGILWEDIETGERSAPDVESFRATNANEAVKADHEDEEE